MTRRPGKTSVTASLDDIYAALTKAAEIAFPPRKSHELIKPRGGLAAYDLSRGPAILYPVINIRKAKPMTKRTIHITMEAELLARIDRLAKVLGMTRSDFIAKAARTQSRLGMPEVDGLAMFSKNELPHMISLKIPESFADYSGGHGFKIQLGTTGQLQAHYYAEHMIDQARADGRREAEAEHAERMKPVKSDPDPEVTDFTVLGVISVLAVFGGALLSIGIVRLILEVLRG